MKIIKFPLFGLLLSLCLSASALPDIDKNSWMEQLYKDRPDTRIRDMVIPASHDAGAYGMNGSSDIAPGETGWYNLAKPIVAAWGNTQNVNAYHQLDGGIRSLDLRVLHHKGRPVIVHGLVSVTLEDILRDVKEWSAQHPKELVILEFAKNPGTAEEQEIMHNLVMQYLGDRVLVNSNNRFNATNVTLNHAWQEDKSIILLTSAGHLHNKYDQWWNSGAMLTGVYGDTTSIGSLHHSLINGRGHHLGLNNQDPNRWHNISITFTPAAEAIASGVFGGLIDLFTRQDTPKNLWQLTQKLNFAAAEWIPQWVNEGKKVNFVSADFFQDTKIVDVAIAMNYPEVAAPEAPLALKSAAQYDWVYNDHKSGASEDFSIWKPKTSFGFYPLGYAGMRSHSHPNFPSHVVYDQKNNAVVNPIGYSWVWDDRNSGGRYDVNIWAGIAPRGYTCLGHIATLGYRNEPAKDAMKCVHNSYLVDGNLNNRIWNDRKSGAYIDAGVWALQANDGFSHTSGLFLANRQHWNSANSYPARTIITNKAQSAENVVGHRMLMDELSKKCLTVKHNQAHNGQDVILHTCNNGDNQRWYYDKANGFLRSAMGGNFCLDNRGRLNNGASLGIHECVDHNNLRWDWQSTILTNRNNANVAVDASCRNDYCAITNYQKHGGANQRWHWLDVLSFRDQQHGKCLAMASHPQEWTKLVPANCGGAQQQFIHWNSELRPLSNPTMCLDIVRADLKNGAEVVSWPCHGKANQRWTISDSAILTQMNGQHSIGDNGASRIIMWQHYGNADQRWTITRH